MLYFWLINLFLPNWHAIHAQNYINPSPSLNPSKPRHITRNAIDATSWRRWRPQICRMHRGGWSLDTGNDGATSIIFLIIVAFADFEIWVKGLRI